MQEGYTIDPERFVNYYTSLGWKVGNTQVQDWKALVRNWNATERKDPEEGYRRKKSDNPFLDAVWDF